MKSNFKINEKFQNIVKMLVFSNCFYQYYISLLILLIMSTTRKNKFVLLAKMYMTIIIVIFPHISTNLTNLIIKIYNKS